MKVYILFKARDMSQKKKEFIIDKIFTSYQGALKREDRLHGYNSKFSNSLRQSSGLMPYHNSGSLLVSETQQTYIINKSVKGLLTEGKKAEKKNTTKTRLKFIQDVPSYIEQVRKYAYNNTSNNYVGVGGCDVGVLDALTIAARKYGKLRGNHE